MGTALQLMIPGGAVIEADIKRRFDESLVRFDAWYLVAVAILIVVGGAVLLGMAAWCVIFQNKRFSGRFHFNNGFEVFMECV